MASIWDDYNQRQLNLFLLQFGDVFASAAGYSSP